MKITFFQVSDEQQQAAPTKSMLTILTKMKIDIPDRISLTRIKVIGFQGIIQTYLLDVVWSETPYLHEINVITIQPKDNMFEIVWRGGEDFEIAHTMDELTNYVQQAIQVFEKDMSHQSSPSLNAEGIPKIPKV